MEKQGVIKEGLTPKLEDKHEKKATDQKPEERLDDDFTKRAADTASESLESGK